MKNFLYLCFVLLSTSLNAQWETLTPDATANAGVILRNESTANAKLLIGVSSCSGCFAPHATANDAVYGLGGSNVGNWQNYIFK
jgi:predicted small integral membrane protein